jgi:hypothetical protein
MKKNQTLRGPRQEADPGTVTHACGRLEDAIGQMDLAISRTEYCIQRPPRDEKTTDIPITRRSLVSSQISDLTDQIDCLTDRLNYVNEAF